MIVLTMKILLFSLIATGTLIQSTHGWTNLGSTSAGMSLGKKSTALDVLTVLNRSNQLFPYCKTTAPGDDAAAVAVVTGGNAGIGAVAAKTLALAGMQVVLCARNVASARQVVDSWPAHLSSRVDIQQLDLANLTSIQEAARSVCQRYPEISLLLNNAGVMAPPNKLLTAQGIELQFGTNHVGHHMWTRLLLPQLNDDGRIVTVASTAHSMASSGKVQAWQPSDYSAWREYGKSKLANILFAKRLQELLVLNGKQDIKSVSLHPGVISTSLWQYLPKIVQPFTRLFADKTVDQGAATSVYCCLADDVQGAAYYSDCKVVQPTSTAEDVMMRKKLWEYTEALIQEKGFELPSELVRVADVALEAEPSL